MTAPTTGLELLRLALTEQEAADPRALQVETGASQAAGCRAESLFRLLRVPESDSRLRLDATIGKAGHAYFERALARLDDSFKLLVEHRAAYRNVFCTIDLGYVAKGLLVDWKLPKKSKIAQLKKNGIGAGYESQLHLGGAALRAEGYDIHTVALACLPRDGEFDEAWEWSKPLDLAIANAAADRVAAEKDRAARVGREIDGQHDPDEVIAAILREINRERLRDEHIHFCRSFCLAGETEIVTRRGLLPIAELAGSEPELLIPVAHMNGVGSRTVWERCEVRSFGVQPLMRIKLRRIHATKTVYATAEHRWLTRDGIRVTTSNLKEGVRLRSIRRGDINHLVQVAPGVAQGFVYGDGHVGKNGGTGLLNVYDASPKQPLLEFFQPSRKVRTSKGWLIPSLPRFWKEAPDLRESRSFLLSWLSGYFAADGHVSSNGGCEITSASRASVETVRSICAIVGIGYSPVSTKFRTGFGVEPTALYKVNLTLRDLPDWFFLLPHHIERARAAVLKKARPKFDWVVEEVSLTDRVEEVFCAVVPGIEAFALADGLMTMNCPHVTTCRGPEREAVDPADPITLEAAQQYAAAYLQKQEAELLMEEWAPYLAGQPPLKVEGAKVRWVGGNPKTSEITDVATALEAYELLVGPLPTKTVESTTPRYLRVFPEKTRGGAS